MYTLLQFNCTGCPSLFNWMKKCNVLCPLKGLSADYGAEAMNYLHYEHLHKQHVTRLVSKYYESKLKRGALQPRMEQALQLAIERIEAAAEPKIIWKKVPIIHKGKRCAVSDEFHWIDSKKFSQVLFHSDSAVVCAGTLGEAMDHELKSENLRMYERVVLDQAASSVMEIVMDIAQKKIQQSCLAGEGISQRYSPGYCDWSIEGQKTMASLLPLDILGIKLTPSCLMSPRKSVTALLGVGAEEVMKAYGNTCVRCSRHNCAFRRETSEITAGQGGVRENLHTSI